MAKTAFITGASRGIGREIALTLAKKGYNIVVAAKTTDPNPKIPGTIFSVAEEIEALGVKALPLKVDIRDDQNVADAIQKTKETFGSINVLVNNASAINLASTENIDMKRYDLMFDINVRGTFLVSKLCIPLLKGSENPHILTLSPPLNFNPVWFANFTAYTMAKYGMSMTVIGLSEELKQYKIAVNALWPRTTIATAAVQNLLGGDSLISQSRTPAIMADAAAVIFDRPSATNTGNFYIDDVVLRESGVTDFDKYAVDPTQKLAPDLFLD
jgi:citronellol/citronellal dehydrogenase